MIKKSTDWEHFQLLPLTGFASLELNVGSGPPVLVSLLADWACDLLCKQETHIPIKSSCKKESICSPESLGKLL